MGGLVAWVVERKVILESGARGEEAVNIVGANKFETNGMAQVSVVASKAGLQ